MPTGSVAAGGARPDIERHRTLAQVIALHKKPADPVAFDAHHHGTHIPLAKTPPGQWGCHISRGPIGRPARSFIVRPAGVACRTFRTSTRAAPCQGADHHQAAEHQHPGAGFGDGADGDAGSRRVVRAGE
jgi:hypothetical protein